MTGIEAPIHVENVWKSYGSVEAVRGLSLIVPPRSIYGFLGPNGAGKSTTIRMILGLQKADRGHIRLFGRSIVPDPLPLLARTGALVENPSLYAHLTGRENLEVHRRLIGASPRAIVESLATVDLIHAADRLVRGYSTGMKQRLGVAQALLSNPELLVLDEPTNGLDPAGIHEVRALIQELPRQRGMTIFLSSHLLAEVEQIATHLAIVSAGQLRFEGTAEDLRSLRRPVTVVDMDEVGSAAELLERHGVRFTRDSSRIMISDHAGFSPAGLNSLLVHSGIAVSQVFTRRPSLEETFLELTARPFATEGAEE
jgi:ABC-2 type transport system ATP-binding protein